MSFDVCAAGSEATAISPTSLEMRPCMCNDRCESALFHPAHAYCGTLSSLAAPLHHSPDPSRVPLHPAPIALAALSLVAAALCDPCSHTNISKEQLTAGPRSQTDTVWDFRAR